MKTLLTMIAAGALVLMSTTTSAAEDGKAIFARTCAACHMADGAGLPGVFPPLKKSDFFKSAEPAFLVKMLQNGLSGEIKVNGSAYVSAMPPQDLDAEQTAAVLNYVSTQLVGGKIILTPAQVRKLRAEK